MKVKVCHVTSVHKPTDARIFERECTSLTQKYDVTLIAPNVEDYESNGVHVRGVYLPQSRIKRQRRLCDVLQKMKDVDADVYHFHDPELIPIGLKIKKEGKRIIFDSHEDIPAQILCKTYIPTHFLRYLISKYYEIYERRSLRQYDAIVSVTPVIVERLKTISPNVYMLTNFPLYKETDDNRKWENKLVFAGMVSSNWNLHHVLEIIKDIDVDFELAGPCHDNYLSLLETMTGWEKVHYHGVISHEEVFKMLSKCKIGLAIESHNNPNGGGRKGSIGVTKLFEYMMAGIPVIATDLENWIPIIEGNKCGFCIDCENVSQIKEKILYLLNHPKEAKEMGDNGQKAVRNEYCWQTQEQVLFDMYEKVLKR